MTEVASQVCEVIAARMRRADHNVQLSDTLDSLGLESLDVLELAFDLEQRFNIEIPFNANSNLEFETVGELVQAVARLIAASAEKAGTP